ncbi:MAG: AIR synthase-related protein [Acutalibacteraceae bacterium]|nr:AIR synthase-related protein [Acutalibacteraceae bacterium]
MGVGMIIAINKEDVDTALSVLKEAGENAFVLGEVVEGDKEVIFE